MKKVIVFGNGSFAKTVTYYIETITDWCVCGYTTDLDITSESFNGKEYIPFSKFLSNYNPKDYEIVMGIGYNKMNELRKDKFTMLKDKGYSFPNLIHPSAIVNNTEFGQGNIILENVVIEPNSTMGDSNIVWSSVLLGHDCQFGSYNHFAACSLVAGNCCVGNNCFFGNHSTVRDGVTVANYSLIGAGAYLSKNSKEFDVVVPAKAIFLEKKSTYFI